MKAKTYILTLAALSILTGCGTTHSMRKVEASGFIDNYDELQESSNWEAKRVYTAPDIDFSKYDKIMIERVVVFATPDSALGKMPLDQIKPLIDYFDAKLRQEIGAVYPLAAVPGPQTLILRVALTDAKASRPLRDLTSNILPYGIALSSLRKATFGTHTAVGTTQAEVEVIDSLSGKRIAAAVDARAGRKMFRRKFEKWADYQQACDHWSNRIRTVLEESKNKTTK